MENELPKFQRLARYPTELENEWFIGSESWLLCEDGTSWLCSGEASSSWPVPPGRGVAMAASEYDLVSSGLVCVVNAGDTGRWSADREEAGSEDGKLLSESIRAAMGSEDGT